MANCLYIELRVPTVDGSRVESRNGFTNSTLGQLAAYETEVASGRCNRVAFSVHGFDYRPAVA